MKITNNELEKIRSESTKKDRIIKELENEIDELKKRILELEK